jgi:hypothetical protein
MSTEIDSAEYARALIVAETLKQQLEMRLVNKTFHGFSSGCGVCVTGPSRVVAIEMPTSYRHNIAMWRLWSCDMEDSTGKGWDQCIAAYIPRTELYLMFRQAFAGIDVPFDHPYAQWYRSQPAPFVPSGRTVEMSDNKPVFVRPVGDLNQSVWVNAELRIDSCLPQYASNEALIACNVDALELGQRRGRGAGNYYYVDHQSVGRAFYVCILGASRGQDIYLPIARVVAVNKEAGTATIELDQSVEFFTPV